VINLDDTTKQTDPVVAGVTTPSDDPSAAPVAAMPAEQPVEPVTEQVAEPVADEVKPVEPGVPAGTAGV
jgi:hypothetical protein